MALFRLAWVTLDLIKAVQVVVTVISLLHRTIFQWLLYAFVGHWLDWHPVAAGHWPRSRKRSVQLQQPSEGEWRGEAEPMSKQGQEWGTGELEEWSQSSDNSASGWRDGREHSRTGLLIFFFAMAYHPHIYHHVFQNLKLIKEIW